MSQNDCTSGRDGRQRQWLTVKETAECLGISEKSVYAAIRHGNLRAMVRRGYTRGYRISAEEVTRWMHEEWEPVM